MPDENKQQPLFDPFTRNALDEIERLDRELREAVIRAEKAEADAIRDPGLEIFNRRFINIQHQKLHDRSVREGTPMAVLFVDVDGFKTVNDTLGHAAGDAVLRTTAATLEERHRSSDFVGRYGGEELVVLLPNCKTEQDAAKVAENARLDIGAHLTDLGNVTTLTGQPVHAVSASIGIAFFDPKANGTETAAQVMNRADKAMYEAKKGDRPAGQFPKNQACLSSATGELRLIPRTEALEPRVLDVSSKADLGSIGNRPRRQIEQIKLDF